MSFHHGESFIIVITSEEISGKLDEIRISGFSKHLGFGNQKVYLTANGGLGTHPADAEVISHGDLQNRVGVMQGLLLQLGRE